MLRFAAVALLCLAACADNVTGPPRAVPSHAVTQNEEQGPPPPHQFGPDSYSVGVFTGQGIDRPGAVLREVGTRPTGMHRLPRERR